MKRISAWDINGNTDYELSTMNSLLSVSYYDRLSETAKRTN